MTNSRRGLTGITLAVGLGVAVSTNQGVAHADSTEPGTAPGDPASTAPPSADGPAAPETDGDSGQDQAKPSTKTRPRVIFDGTRITIRRDIAKPIEEAANKDDDEVDGPAASGDNVDVVKKSGEGDAAQDAKKKHPPAVRPPRILNLKVPERPRITASPTEQVSERRAATFTDSAAMESATTTQQRRAVSTFDMDRIAVRHASLTPSLKIDAPQTTAVPVAATAAPARFITNLVSAFGLRPSPITPARPALPLPRLLELAFVAIRRTFFNETPAARLDQETFAVNPQTGVATGRVIGTDPDGDRLTYRLQDPPAQGSVELGPDGSFTYTPQDGWTHTTGGDVEFTVAVSDATSPHLHLFTGGGHETTYTVRFTYDGINNDPAVQVTEQPVQPDGKVRYTVITSDRDGDPVRLTTSSVNGDLTGELTKDEGGVKTYAYTFTPNEKYAHDLTLGGSTTPGKGSATFAVSDDFGGEASTTREITIEGVNAAPVVRVVPQAGGVYEITVTDGDDDPVTLTPSVTNGTLVGGETTTKGVYRYTFTVNPDYAHDLTKDGATATGTATVGFVARDDHGGTSQPPYADDITVVGTNDKPVLNVSEDNGVYNVEILDGDIGDLHTITPTVEHGRLTERRIDDRHYEYTFAVDPDYAHSLTKDGAIGTGTASVSFVARDDHGGTSNVIKKDITVVGTNDKPEITVDEDNGVYTVTVLDDDTRDIHTITPTVEHGTLVGGETATKGVYKYTFTVDPIYAHSLTKDGATGTGTARVGFSVNDDHGGKSDEYSDTITVAGTNAKPQLVVTKTNNVYSVEIRDGDTVDLHTIAPTVTNGTLTERKIDDKHYEYTFTVDPTYAHSLTKNGATAPGEATVTFTARDDHGGTSDPSPTDTITVAGTNDKPRLDVKKENGVYKVEILDNDTVDLHTITPTVTNGTLTERKIDDKHYEYTFTVDPTYAHSLTKNGATAPGEATVTFTARDDHGGTSDPSPTDTITVVGVNREPSAVITGSTQISRLDGVARFTITGASDADGDTARVTGVTAVPGSGATVVDNGDNTWTVTYRANYADAHPLGPNGSFPVSAVNVTMTDGYGAEPTTQQLSVTVVGLNREPTLTTEPAVDRPTGVVSGTATWTDRDNDPLTNRTATLSDPSKGVLTYNATTGKYTFTPNQDARADAAVINAPIEDRRVIVTFTVSDGYGPHSEDVSVMIAPPDNTVLGTFASDEDADTLDSPNNVVVSSDGTSIFVSNERTGRITRINAQTGEAEQSYNVGDFRTGEGTTLQLVATPSTTNPAVYALDGEGRLWKFDGTNDWEPEAVTLPGAVRQIAVSPDGSTVYFASDEGSRTRLRYLDTATMTVRPITDPGTPVVFLPPDANEMAVDPRTGMIVVNVNDKGFSVINPVTGASQKGATADIGDFTLNGQYVFAVSNAGASVSQSFITGGADPERTFQVSDGEKVVVSPDGERAYVMAGNRVIVLDIRRDSLQEQVGSIPLGPGTSTDIAISPDGTKLYVTKSDDTVKIISISPAGPPEEPSPPSTL